MKLIPLEIDEQIAVVEYLEILCGAGRVVMFSALPNNIYTDSIKQKGKQIAEGLKPGFPDLVVVFKTKVLFLEMKRTKGGVMSAYQKRWQEALEGVGGSVIARVAYGFDEAKNIIDDVVTLER